LLVPIGTLVPACDGLGSNQLFIAFRDVSRQRADLKVVITDLSYRRDLGCGPGQPALLKSFEFFYNPTRKHTNEGMLSPVDFETRQQKTKRGKCLGN